MSTEAIPPDCPPAPRRRRVPLYVRVIIGVAAGAALGAIFRDRPYVFGVGNDDLGPVGLLVIRLLKALATPLILFAILDSFLKTSLSARSGGRLLGICALNVSVAMTIGLLIMNLARPGKLWAGKLEELGAELGPRAGAAPASPGKPTTPGAPVPTLSPLKNIAGFVPESVLDPFAKNMVISVVLLGILAGAALRHARNLAPDSPAIVTVAHVVEVGYHVLTTMLLWVAEAIPVAALLIVAQVVGKAGLSVFAVLWIFLATMLAGLLVHALVYYPFMAWLVGRRTPRQYLRGGADAILTGVSCNSSLATMPVTLRCLRSLGVSETSARLSACVGTNFNNDGIMLYEAMAALFLCQAFGYDLTLGQQLTVVLASIMAGVGIAGIPEAGLIILPLVLSAAGLPEAAVAAAIPLIVPVDWIIARVRSGVNVMADMLVAMMLDRFEKPVAVRVA